MVSLSFCQNQFNLDTDLVSEATTRKKKIIFALPRKSSFALVDPTRIPYFDFATFIAPICVAKEKERERERSERERERECVCV